jgi:hypothetical protein
MSRAFCLFLAAVALGWTLSQGVFAQEPADSPDVFRRAPAAPKTAGLSPAEAFAAVNGEFLALNKQLTELQQQFSEAPTPEARQELRRQYEAVVAQSQARLPKLQEVALAAYAAEPNKDPQVIKQLLGLVGYHFVGDDYEASLEVAR